MQITVIRYKWNNFIHFKKKDGKLFTVQINNTDADEAIDFFELKENKLVEVDTTKTYQNH